ncbi:unnamed protein product [Phytophthora fragariaefolia]|uniref:Unnamed protein product n=1 Tax=Phytophthora fragariaefolia TaxID=1490495 RepID=A0A9W6XJ09_9STRA|nr:unnamed protein product [Phytophthora fragariaefolia]
MRGADTGDAFSVVQCVAKRTRQLERLLYMVESTATKFQQTKTPPTGADMAALTSRSRAQAQKRYGKLLLDFLEEQRDLKIHELLAEAIHLEVGECEVRYS